MNLFECIAKYSHHFMTSYMTMILSPSLVSTKAPDELGVTGTDLEIPDRENFIFITPFIPLS